MKDELDPYRLLVATGCLYLIRDWYSRFCINRDKKRERDRASLALQETAWRENLERDIKRTAHKLDAHQTNVDRELRYLGLRVARVATFIRIKYGVAVDTEDSPNGLDR